MSEYRTCDFCGCYLPDGETQCRACGEISVNPSVSLAADSSTSRHGFARLYTREPLDGGWTVPTGKVEYVYATDIVDGEEIRYRVKV